jgi:hypothetical protein
MWLSLLDKPCEARKNCHFLFENLEVSPLAKCKKSAVQPNGKIILPLVLNFALCANELSAQAAKSGLPPGKTVGNFGHKIAIS